MFRVIMTLLAAGIVIYLSYLFSKYVSRGMNRSSASRYMRLVDQITVGQDRHIAIMQVGVKYLLVGITAGQITVLSDLEEEDLLLLSPGDGNGGVKTPDFQEWMKRFRGITKKGGKG